MAFNLSTPTAALAFEMALRNQRAIDSSAGTDAQARSAVSKALAPGNDQLAPFDDIYRQYMDPAEEARRAQAQAFNTYLIGLPELLAQAAKEGRSTGGGGAGSGGVDLTGNMNVSGYQSAQERLQNLMNSFPKQTESPYDPLGKRTTQSSYVPKTSTDSGTVKADTTKTTESSFSPTRRPVRGFQ